MHEKIEMVKQKLMHAYQEIIEKLCYKLCHPGRTFALKAKELIGSDQTLLFIN